MWVEDYLLDPRAIFQRLHNRGVCLYLTPPINLSPQGWMGLVNFSPAHHGMLRDPILCSFGEGNPGAVSSWVQQLCHVQKAAFCQFFTLWWGLCSLKREKVCRGFLLCSLIEAISETGHQTIVPELGESHLTEWILSANYLKHPFWSIWLWACTR